METTFDKWWREFQAAGNRTGIPMPENLKNVFKIAYDVGYVQGKQDWKPPLNATISY